MNECKVWIPEKFQIVNMLDKLSDKIRMSNTISDIEDDIVDELSSIECHVQNRAIVEKESKGQHTCGLNNE